MTNLDRWLLPDGVDEILPEEAQVIEHLRRQILDKYHSWGYDLVIPPMIEFTESLLSGSGRDLDLMTFRVTDQMSGRLMGIRADITPQVARMDAHSLRADGPSRFCYSGTVMHTRARGPFESRTPISIGVELFGEESLFADIEVIKLFLKSLSIAGVEDVYLDLGHVDIVRGLIGQADLSDEQELEVFDLLQRKAISELEAYIVENIENDEIGGWLKKLPTLTGGIEVLEIATRMFDTAPNVVQSALEELKIITHSLTDSGVNIHLDLSEAPGFHYHTGVVFAGYIQGYGKALGNGGRYDCVGQAFGRPRPATGFAFDLKSLVSQGKSSLNLPMGIFVPYSADPRCQEQAALLRAQGYRVIQGFEGQDINMSELKCDRQLVKIGEKYVVEFLS